MSDELSQVQQVRRAKLAKLREKGIEPYAYAFERSHKAAGAADVFVEAERGETLSGDGHGSEVTVAGRLMSYRGHGKSAFAHIEDVSGQIQVYFKKNVLGDEAFDDLDLLDLGDWIGIRGPLFRTRKGEITIQVDEWSLLSKSLRPLPLGKTEIDEETGERVSHSGFADTEVRYRQRYADLAVHPEVREVFRARARTIQALRAFMESHEFLEVETPALQPLYGGAMARPFVTHHNTLDQTMYLRIADELYLKRLIVGGMERVYEICKDFRNEGVDRLHNPEFTMLEFYMAFADYHTLMDLTEAMVSSVARSVTGSTELVYQGTSISLEPPFNRVPMIPSLTEALGFDAAQATRDQLHAKAKELRLEGLDGAGKGKLLDKLFGELVQPKLIQPTFVVDHPLEISPLAKAKRGDESLVERFELFMVGEEFANAYSELNDPIDQRERFESQAELRSAGDDEAHGVDEDYLRALEYGMPPTAGLGMGVDRLVMLLTDQASIRDVILFPMLRDE